MGKDRAGVVFHSCNVGIAPFAKAFAETLGAAIARFDP
jgi:hypothetical protein